MTRLWTAWNVWVDAWSATERGTSMALFRLVMGAFLVLDMLWALQLVDPLYIPQREGGLAVSRPRFWSIEMLGGPSADLAWDLHYVALALSVLFFVGFGGRITALLLGQVLVAIHSLPLDIGGGYDRLLYNALWLFVLGNGTATLSVDCKLWTGSWRSDQPILAFARYLAVWQVVTMYVSTALAKGGSTWNWPFEAVFRAFLRSTYARWNEYQAGLAVDLYHFTRLGTFVAWWWEVSFFILGLWYLARNGWLGEQLHESANRYDLRVPWLAIGLWTHMLLWVLMDLGWFTGFTLAFYILLYRPEEWEEVLPWTRAKQAGSA